ncbi:MAG: hypothetical protein JKY53_05520 [Flavobacteriales bacterium]|nr:hypothetical protein [Flavobacteriales bacterium]
MATEITSDWNDEIQFQFNPKSWDFTNQLTKEEIKHLSEVISIISNADKSTLVKMKEMLNFHLDFVIKKETSSQG